MFKGPTQETLYQLFLKVDVNLMLAEFCGILFIFFRGRFIMLVKTLLFDNIIGLCYFFTQIMNNSESKNLYKQELLLVIDDPVSSFDFENKIGIISYLSSQIEKTVKGNSNSKIVILTHDLSTEFDLRKSLTTFCKASKKKPWGLETAYLELKNKKFSEFEYRRSEYTELFKFVYKYATSESNEGNLEIGNCMRRVLESFVTFSYKKDMNNFISNDDDILKLLAEKSGYNEGFLARLLLNNESHFIEKLQVDYDNCNLFQYFSDEEKKVTAKNLICLLYILNTQHVLAHLHGENDVDQTIKKWYNKIPSNLVAK